MRRRPGRCTAIPARTRKGTVLPPGAVGWRQPFGATRLREPLRLGPGFHTSSRGASKAWVTPARSPPRPPKSSPSNPMRPDVANGPGAVRHLPRFAQDNRQLPLAARLCASSVVAALPFADEDHKCRRHQHLQCQGHEPNMKQGTADQSAQERPAYSAEKRPPKTDRVSRGPGDARAHR